MAFFNPTTLVPLFILKTKFLGCLASTAAFFDAWNLALHICWIWQASEWIDKQGGRRQFFFWWRLGPIFAVLTHVIGLRMALVSLFQVLFHFVGSRKLFLTDRTWKDFAGGPFMIQKGVPLEAVFVLEVLTNLHALTLHTPWEKIRQKALRIIAFPNLESRLQSIHTIWKSHFLSKNCSCINIPKGKVTDGQSYPRTKLLQVKLLQAKLRKGKVTLG